MKRMFAKIADEMLIGLEVVGAVVAAPAAAGLAAYGIACIGPEIHRYLTDTVYGMIELIVCAVGVGLVLGCVLAAAVILRKRSFRRKISNRRRRCLGYIDADTVCRVMEITSRGDDTKHGV